MIAHLSDVVATIPLDNGLFTLLDQLYTFVLLLRSFTPTLLTLFVEINGFEPLTPCLQSRCSSQLSYTPRAVGLRGLEPRTSTLSV